MCARPTAALAAAEAPTRRLGMRDNPDAARIRAHFLGRQCRIRALAHPAYLATYWHIHLFNPGLPAAVKILTFAPDWPAGTASASA